MLLKSHEWEYVERNGIKSNFTEGKYFKSFEDNPEFLKDSVIFWTLRSGLSWVVKSPDEKLNMMLNGHVWKRDEF